VSPSENFEYEEASGGGRYGFLFGIGIVVLIGLGLVVAQIARGDHKAVSHMPEVVMIKPLPPPPTPPPKPPDPPKEVAEKMIEQTPMDQPEDKPDDSPKAAPSLTTSLVGPGSDGFGLSKGNGGGFGAGGGGGRRGSRFGWYASEIQKAIQDALNRSQVARQAQFVQKLRLWADASGRVTRLKLSGSTGDPGVDHAIEDALDGLQLPDPPPKDMPMPIVMRITARRPG
jgi:outer membrane biosynthesis protein TonB